MSARQDLTLEICHRDGLYNFKDVALIESVFESEFTHVKAAVDCPQYTTDPFYDEPFKSPVRNRWSVTIPKLQYRKRAVSMASATFEKRELSANSDPTTPRLSRYSRSTLLDDEPSDVDELGDDLSTLEVSDDGSNFRYLEPPATPKYDPISPRRGPPPRSDIRTYNVNVIPPSENPYYPPNPGDRSRNPAPLVWKFSITESFIWTEYRQAWNVLSDTPRLKTIPRPELQHVSSQMAMQGILPPRGKGAPKFDDLGWCEVWDIDWSDDLPLS